MITLQQLKEPYFPYSSFPRIVSYQKTLLFAALIDVKHICQH